jgi:hypothetical protein
LSWWRNLIGGGGPEGITPNDNGPANTNPGDPDGFEYQASETEARSLPVPAPSAWDGWPSGWDVPNWQVDTGINKLVDIAWACLDLNSNIVSAMPVYQMRGGKIIDPEMWMDNPDPTIYTCWQEFAKQLFWDYQMGEAFVLPYSWQDGLPRSFRVVPPWLINVEMKNGVREYKMGTIDVTDEILHIRYHSTSTGARGIGPLEMAGARQTNIALLQRYVNTLAETGGVPLYWIELERKISQSEGIDILTRWMESRAKYQGQPALVGGGSKLNQARTMDAKEMGLLELSQFSESRIAVLLGVPPFLVGLAGASGSLTYSNITDLFDFHDRSSLRPKSKFVMKSLSNWALPRGRSCELNRDDYTRLRLDQRVQAYQTMFNIRDETTGERMIDIEQLRAMERLQGEPAAKALTGGSE